MSDDKTLTGSGTRSFPEIVALRLLIELRSKVGRLSTDLTRRQSSGSDTVRLAVLKLSKVAHQAGIGFQTSRTQKLRAEHEDLRTTLVELASTARLAGLPAFAGICERINSQLEALMAPGDVTAARLDILYIWIEASIAYLGGTPLVESFPEANFLADCLFDPRWEGLYAQAEIDPLADELIRDRRQAQRKA